MFIIWVFATKLNYIYCTYYALILILLVIEKKEKHAPIDTKHTKNIHAIRKQQRRHTISDQSSLSFIKPMGLWKHSRRQSMFKNTLPTVSGIDFISYAYYNFLSSLE